MIIKTYTELAQCTTFIERYNYLKLNAVIGQDTFGFDRYINQRFYKSLEWRRVRDFVIVRDNGCDLGMDGYEINNGILIHHLNPIDKRDVEEATLFLLNPEYLITTKLSTHNAIHYGDEKLLTNQRIIERTRNDMCPWKR